MAEAAKSGVGLVGSRSTSSEIRCRLGRQSLYIQREHLRQKKNVTKESRRFWEKMIDRAQTRHLRALRHLTDYRKCIAKRPVHVHVAGADLIVPGPKSKSKKTSRK